MTQFIAMVALLVIVSVALAVLAIYSPIAALLVPFLFSPTLILLYYTRIRAPNLLKPLFLTYLFTGTIGLLIASVIQMEFSLVGAFALLGSQTWDYIKEGQNTIPTSQLPAEDVERRRQMAHNSLYFVFLAYFSFIPAGLIEESLKLVGVLLAKHFTRKSRPDIFNRPLALMLFAIASSQGLSTTETLGFVYQTATTEHTKLKMILLTAAQRVFIPVHALSGVLIAIGLMRVYNARAALSAAKQPPIQQEAYVDNMTPVTTPTRNMTATTTGRNSQSHGQLHSRLESEASPSPSSSYLTRWKLPASIRLSLKELYTVLKFPVFFHGLFDFYILSIQAIDGVIGFVQPEKTWTIVSSYGGVVVILIWVGLVIRRQWKKIVVARDMPSLRQDDIVSGGQNEENRETERLLT